MGRVEKPLSSATAVQMRLGRWRYPKILPETAMTFQRERDWRMSKIFRKLTNRFRSNWGRDLFAAVRSVVNT
jgi:hypothetical protein